MSNLSEQHGAWMVGIKINHPDINNGKEYIISFGPVDRLYKNESTGKVQVGKDKEKGFTKLVPITDPDHHTQEDQDQQTMHAGIVRLWSEWNKDYSLDGLDKVESTVIPALERQFGVNGITWADHLEFRRFKVNTDGKIYESSAGGRLLESGEVLRYDVKTGEFINPWLTESEWNQLQANRLTANYTASIPDSKPTAVQTKVEKPSSYSFLNASTVLTQVHESAKQASKTKK